MYYSYLRWFWLFESESVIGERGQVTIPKSIRQKKKLLAGEKVVFKIEGDKIVIEKNPDKKEKERLLKEYYIKFAKENEELSEEMIAASNEGMPDDN